MLRRTSNALRKHTRVLVWGSVGHLRPTKPAELLLEGLPERDDGEPWRFVSVSCGLKHVSLVTEEGHLVMMGNNRHGQIGQSEAYKALNEHQPFLYDMQFTAPDETPTHVECGCNYNIFYRSGAATGVVVGYNVYGQLALGHKTVLDNSHGFAEWDPQAPWLRGRSVDRVVCGHNHTMLLMSDGHILGSGSNTWGELGLGTAHTVSPMMPTRVTELHDKEVVDVAAGNSFSVFLTAAGHVYACGAHDQGQLPFQAHKPTLVPLTRDGRVGLLRTRHIAAGADFWVIGTSTNEVFVRGSMPDVGCTRGENRLRNVQLDDHMIQQEVVGLRCGTAAAYIFGADGSISGFGSNVEGQLMWGANAADTPAVFEERTCLVLPPSRSGMVPSPTAFAAGMSCAFLLDEMEDYDVGAAPPVTCPPPKRVRRKLKIG